jgi:chromate transporter
MHETSVPFKEALLFWVKLGFINFGGPAGQIAIIHREMVERKRWVSEELFLRALNFCMLLPGPEAQQLAIYIGWRLHGTLGGIAADLFFVIPSVFVLMALSWLVVSHGDVPAVAGFFYGIQPVVVAIVAEAVHRIGKRTLCHPALILIAAAAFIALHLLSLPFPLVILAAALGGLVLDRLLPRVFHTPAHAERSPGDEAAETNYPARGRTIRLGAVFLALWAIPVAVVWFWRGGSDVLMHEALFFTKAAFVTFGGAYSVLSYIADTAVNQHGWLDAEQMVLGLGFAESTPGPLIMVTQYVGFLGAWKFHGGFSPLLNGALGALVTTYVTFLPSFFFIFAGSPYIEALSKNLRIHAALTCVTAAVVGVILNLAVFFGSRVLVEPDGAVDIFAVIVAAGSFIIMRRFKPPIPLVVFVGAIAGMVWKLWM